MPEPTYVHTISFYRVTGMLWWRKRTYLCGVARAGGSREAALETAREMKDGYGADEFTVTTQAWGEIKL